MRELFLLLGVLFLVTSVISECQEENVSIDVGTNQKSTKSTRNTAADCAKACTGSCQNWVWNNRNCQLLPTKNPGKKIGKRGAVSGGRAGAACPLKTTGVECHYVQSRDPVVCIFPFFGEVPGSRNTTTRHDSCLKTKRGKYWCATKLSIDNKLLATSDQTKDIDCGSAVSSQGTMRCSTSQAGSGSGCPSMVSVQQRIAALEKKNKELEDQLKQSGCGPVGGNGGWGAWSSWTKCNSTCMGTQTRTRTCKGKASTCKGLVWENKNCGGNCPPSKGTAGSSATSCAGRCGKPSGIGQCQCESSCTSFGDCCKDYTSTCANKNPNPNSCAGRCGASFNRKNSCQCNLDCASFKNCCQDFSATCSSASKPKPSSSATRTAPTATKADRLLGGFTEKLLAIDENNAMSKITLNTGCTTRVGNPNDCSSAKLFTRVDTAIFRKPVYQKLMAMYENYKPDTLQVEDNTRAEKAEEKAFIDEVMKTSVMRETLAFLKKNKFFTKSDTDFKKLLHQLWFGIYSRGMRIKGSSGFEHVFLGEKKGGKVQGFHNWVYFYHLEKNNQVNYLGHWEAVDLGGRGTGLSFTFTWGKEQKPFASMLVGTSPELELAVYTTCLLAKGANKCPISLGGALVEVEVHVFDRPNGVQYIASSFMDW